MKDSTTTVSIAHPRVEVSHCDLRLLALVLLAAHGIALGHPRAAGLSAKTRRR